MTNPDGTIETLADEVEARGIARWLFDLWGDYDPKETYETCLKDLLEGLDPHVAIPKTFVWREDGQVEACVSIIRVDIQDRPDLGPWLANLVVRPAHRGRGIARRLCRHLMDYAATISTPLYLYTDNLQASYAKLGWRETGDIFVGDKPVTLMTWDGMPSDEGT